MPVELLWLLLPVAAGSGWFAAKRAGSRSNIPPPRRFPDAEYLRGLNYFLDDRPDKAVDLFVRVLDVNEDTVETHLALGGVYRRRGEVDRAIQVHQNLIARTTLSPRQRAQALLELGEDYMKSGLLDRAEGLFRELQGFTEHEAVALGNLALIHQQERDWSAAIEDCRRLESVTGRSQRTEIGQFYCELAAEARVEGETEAAELHLQAALQTDPACARAYLMSARMAMQRADYDVAIEQLLLVEQQVPVFAVETVAPLRECYEAQGKLQELLDHLVDLLGRRPSAELTIVVSDLCHELDRDEEAPALLKGALLRQPNLPAFRKLLELLVDSGDEREEIAVAIALAGPLLESTVRYRCKRCGFQGRSLHWRCPGCQQWSTVEPCEHERIAATPAPAVSHRPS